MLYVIRTGCQWRALPHDLPPWRIVYWDFMAWRDDGTLKRVLDWLRSAVRCDTQPTAAVLDRQSSKTNDAGTKFKGRKRDLLVDTMGRTATLAPADVQDRDGAKTVPETLRPTFCWVKKVWADGAYGGQLVDWVAGLRVGRLVELEIVKRSDEAVGFEVIAKRSLGWLNRSRRLNDDDEATIRFEDKLSEST